MKPRNRASIDRPSAVRMIRPPVTGTRLTQTRMFTPAYARMRAFSGSKSGVAPATATVTG